jgi:hypothetical protein
MDLFEFIFRFVLLCLFTFSISSMLLYSPGPEELREKWIKFFGKFKNKLLRKPMYLMICQLCCSFWIALISSFWIIGYSTFITSFILSIIAAGISWMLGAFTLKCLYSKAYYEKQIGSNNDK